MHRVSSNDTHELAYDGHQGEVGLQIVSAHLGLANSHQPQALSTAAAPSNTVVDQRSPVYGGQSQPQAIYSQWAPPAVCYAADTGQPLAAFSCGPVPDYRALPSAPPMCDEDSIYLSPYERLSDGLTQQTTSFAYAERVSASSPYERPSGHWTQQAANLAYAEGTSYRSPYERQFDHGIHQTVPLEYADGTSNQSPYERKLHHQTYQTVPLEYTEHVNDSSPYGQVLDRYHQPTLPLEYYSESQSSLPCGPQGHQELRMPTNGDAENLPPILVMQPSSATEQVHSYIGWSLVNFLCCCWPLGLAALVYSVKASSKAIPDDSRRKYSLTARNLNIAATVIFLLLLIIAVPTLITSPRILPRTSENVKPIASYSTAFSYSYYTSSSYYDYYYKVTLYRMERNMGYRYETIYA